MLESWIWIYHKKTKWHLEEFNDEETSIYINFSTIIYYS